MRTDMALENENVTGVHSPQLQLPKLAHDVYRFHAVSKPAASRCNLDCSYCFYLHKASLLEQPHQAKMSDETLERYNTLKRKLATRSYSLGKVANPHSWDWIFLKK